MTPTRTVSPIELLKVLTDAEMSGDLDGGTFVGPADHPSQQAGCIQFMSAGLPKEERYVPAVWQRIQVRCVSGSMMGAETIAGLFMERLNNRNRVTVTQSSNGNAYLIHVIDITSGPSMHFDTPATWEVLLFAELMVGTQPVV